MPTKQSARILIAPLDWGMGHTTRCIPLIRQLMASGHHPVFAGNEWQRQYIATVFPGLELIHLDGYNVRWTGSMASFMTQLPRHLRTVRNENSWLKTQAGKLGIQGVISDNRYGLYLPGIPSVMLTHQLQPISGVGPMADNIVRRMHYRLLGRFDTVWVVDVPEGGYAGLLSHPHVMPQNSAFLGLLSSCTAMPSAAPEPGSVLVVLSGPEPQRSVLSHILKEQLHSYRGMVNFVEGAPVTDSGMLPAHATHYGRLSPDELMPLLGSAEYIFCRSGYSTVMDLLAMGKRAILIPTPGQTEQTYLATHLQQYGFVTMRQDRPDISAAIAACSGCGASTSATNGADFSSFVPIVAKWTEGL